MAGSELEALAQAAAQTLVAAATTDVWQKTKHLIGRLLGCGIPADTVEAQERLEATRLALATVPTEHLAQANQAQAVAWQALIMDFLASQQERAEELKTIIASIRSELPTSQLPSPEHGLAAARDVNISAPGGIAAGVITAPISFTSQR
jgi:hypothetical protein